MKTYPLSTKQNALLKKRFLDEDFSDIFEMRDLLNSKSRDGFLVMRLVLCADARFYLDLEGDELNQACEEIFSDWLDMDGGVDDLAALTQKYADERGCAR